MIYPVIISVVMVLVLWVLMTVVVPSLSETLIEMGGELPPDYQNCNRHIKLISDATPYLIVL